MSRDLTKSFLADICEHPDDDAPRLIFADWLEDHGKPERAEFIRVQIERTRLPWWDAKQVTLRLREKELLASHKKQWLAELPQMQGVVWWEFRRGFVGSALFANFATLRDKASECWTSAPVAHVLIPWPRRSENVETIAPVARLRELSFRNAFIAPGEAAPLADAPLLSTLTILEIHQCSLGLAGFERLLHSPHLAKLTALRVPFNCVGNGSITALYKAASLARLSELDLSETGSDDRYGEDPVLDVVGMASLANWPGLANVRKLSMNGNDIKKRGLQTLLLSHHVRNLKELSVRDNGLKGSSMDAFGSANPALRLDVLDVGENLLRDRGASGMKNAACLAELKVLGIAQCEMTVAGVRTLAGAPFLGTLRKLNLADNGIDSDGLVALLDGNPARLHTLDARNTDIEEVAVKVLADSPDSDSLIELDLSDNDLGDDTVVALAEAEHLDNLLVLKLNYHSFSESAVAWLKESPLGKRLAVLTLDEDAGSGEDDSWPKDVDIPF